MRANEMGTVQLQLAQPSELTPQVILQEIRETSQNCKAGGPVAGGGSRGTAEGWSEGSVLTGLAAGVFMVPGRRRGTLWEQKDWPFRVSCRDL